jgi:hypothetical protein
MRTSGTHKELWMTAVPLGFLFFFIVFASGGAKPFLSLLEETLRASIDWVVNLVS